MDIYIYIYIYIFYICIYYIYYTYIYIDIDIDMLYIHNRKFVKQIFCFFALLQHIVALIYVNIVCSAESKFLRE